MPKIILTRGIPGSGKTYWAERYATSQRDYVNICKDDIRRDYSLINEKTVIAKEEILIAQAFAEKKNVILSNTHFNGIHDRRIRTKFPEAQIEWKQFTDVPLELCIERNNQREDPIPEHVLRSMHKYCVQGTKNAVMCDLDGTLAINEGRSPFDWARVGEDSVCRYVAEALELYRNNGNDVIFVSGRNNCRQETEDWLQKHKIQYNLLLMRQDNDSRPDDIIKEEIYEDHIRNNYRINAIFDDRLKVCRMWYRLGLPLFRVGPPDSNF